MICSADLSRAIDISGSMHPGMRHYTGPRCARGSVKRCCSKCLRARRAWGRGLGERFDEFVAPSYSSHPPVFGRRVVGHTSVRRLIDRKCPELGDTRATVRSHNLLVDAPPQAPRPSYLPLFERYSTGRAHFCVNIHIPEAFYPIFSKLGTAIWVGR